ncbi:major facilitator superfamily domain-containing protein [Coprinopsis sp. MPI-PUGE-AT-0042]|nr:major facilitator superfamily domain-containing protein [Coprinopsis sp. MPI-PUGE-AT-0042]
MTSSREDDGADNSEERNVQARTPLPKFQIFTVFLVQFSEPITATVIYPFINQLIRETGVTGGDEAKTGESVFFIAEAMTVFLWGMASDSFGRKPILLLGPLGLAFAMLGFGLSTTFWPLVFWRCLQGFFNGNIGVSKSVIAELTDKTNIGDAYALVPLMWNTGLTFGPIIGGLLSHPAESWPDTLGRLALLKAYPYLLPCTVASFIALLSFSISAVALKETLPSAKETPLIARLARAFRVKTKVSEVTQPLLPDTCLAEYGSIQNRTSSQPAKPKVADLFVPEFLIILLNFGLFAFTEIARVALVPLFFSTPIDYGGLGLQPYQIGVIMSAFGLINGISSAICVGPAVRRYGPKKVFRFSIPFWLICFAGFPVANTLARQAGYVDWKVICVIVVQYISQLFFSPCYATMNILIVRTCTKWGLVGAGNGLGQTVSCMARSFGPVVASSLFAISVERNLARGNLVYLVLAAFTCLTIWTSQFLPDES